MNSTVNDTIMAVLPGVFTLLGVLAGALITWLIGRARETRGLRRNVYIGWLKATELELVASREVVDAANRYLEEIKSPGLAAAHPGNDRLSETNESDSRERAPLLVRSYAVVYLERGAGHDH